MSYADGDYNGQVYIGHVKWNDDYKNVMLFKTKSDRNDFLTSHLHKLDGNIGIEPAQSTSYIDINGALKDIDNYNYVFYKRDSSADDHYTCAFITNWEIIALHTIRLYIKTDIFQQYFYDTTFYQSYIERGIVTNAANNNNKNYLPEPITADLEVQTQLKTILNTDDWQPIWVLHSASYYNSSTGEYDYAGIGTNSSYGEYGRFIESKSELQTVLKMYGRQTLDGAIEQVQESLQDSGSSIARTLLGILTQWLGGGIAAGSTYQDNKSAFDTITDTLSFAQFQDHRDELIGLYAIPKWLKDNFNGDSNYADNRRVITDEISLTLNNSSLANGYTPRNKKLLTSVCRAYILANRTGLKIPFKPELFENSASIKLGGITMSTSGYQYTIEGYNDDQKSHGEVAYNSERRVGYDANTGVNKALNIIGAGAGAVSSLGAIAGGVATANPVTAIAGAGNAAGSLVRAIDSIGQQEQHIGNNGDLLRITSSRPVLRWLEVNPSVSECEAIDSFFDMYGYSIHKHRNPTDYIYLDINNKKFIRRYWGYVKTQDCNCSTPAPTFYENELKNIFNAGVRLWFNYSHFGDFSVDNTSTNYS